MEALKVRNLSHKFGFSKILKNINFNLAKNKVLSIVGPSGGGKTTLLHLCAGLLDIEDGEVSNTFKKHSIAFQGGRLLPWKNVIDNISLGLLAQGINNKQANKMSENIALKFGLKTDDFSKYPKDLSGGMKQRVALARALVIKPSLLFLDEPFSALDIGLKRELQAILINLLDKEELSIFFITHDLMEAVKLSDEILLLGNTPGEIIKKFNYKTPRNKRDDDYVYQESAKIIQDKEVIKIFGLEVGNAHQ